MLTALVPRSRMAVQSCRGSEVVDSATLACLIAQSLAAKEQEEKNVVEEKEKVLKEKKKKKEEEDPMAGSRPSTTTVTYLH